MSSFFEKIFGFSEASYPETQARLAQILRTEPDKCVPGWQMNYFDVPTAGHPVQAGCFRFDNVAELRKTAAALLKEQGFTQVAFQKEDKCGDSRGLHSQFVNGLFQAASQFNCLEFVGPSVVPERGITCYINDRTQGPACAIACAAGTAFRNYFVPVDPNSLTCGDRKLPEPKFTDEFPAHNFGQTTAHQLNGLADVERIMFTELAGGVKLWRVKNGYIELTQEGSIIMEEIGQKIATNSALERSLIDAVRVGCHFDTEVTDLAINSPVPLDKADCASQVYASACSIGYSREPDSSWEPIAKIALKGAYEATFYAYLIHCCRLIKRGRQEQGESYKPAALPPLFLTKLGGGVFANPAPWICEAMTHGQNATQRLFADLAKQAGTNDATDDNNNNRFLFPIWLTHFRDVEKGYEGFIKTP